MVEESQPCTEGAVTHIYGKLRFSKDKQNLKENRISYWHDCRTFAFNLKSLFQVSCAKLIGEMAVFAGYKVDYPPSYRLSYTNVSLQCK